MANGTRRFLQRNLRNGLIKIKEQAYNTYIHPILEYASSVWDPHTKELVNQTEMMKQRAAHFVQADYHQRHSVTNLLTDLKWEVTQR